MWLNCDIGFLQSIIKTIFSEEKKKDSILLYYFSVMATQRTGHTHSTHSEYVKIFKMCTGCETYTFGESKQVQRLYS